MTDRDRVLAAATELGARVVDYGTSRERAGLIEIEAPDGFVFGDGSCTTLVGEYGRDIFGPDPSRSIPKREVWADLLARLACGVEPDPGYEPKD